MMVIVPSELPYEKQYLTFVALEPGTFSFTRDIEYSIDNGITWNTLVGGTDSPLLNTNDEILWRGKLVPSNTGPWGVGYFSSSGRFDVKGNIMSLLYKDSFVGKTNLISLNGGDFWYLFKNCKIINSKDLVLPTTILTESCYNGMFEDCTLLITAPKLPAKTLARRCYSSMFTDCTSLVNAPELPATILADECYYSMFVDCTSLTIAPELLATILTKECYSGMFWGCTSLNYIKCLATDISAYRSTFAWVINIASLGTFIKATSMSSWTIGVDGIPSGWTVI